MTSEFHSGQDVLDIIPAVGESVKILTSLRNQHLETVRKLENSKTQEMETHKSRQSSDNCKTQQIQTNQETQIIQKDQKLQKKHKVKLNIKHILDAFFK